MITSLYPNECLFKHNNRIHVPPKELSVLTILTENAGKVVGKDFFSTGLAGRGGE